MDLIRKKNKSMQNGNKNLALPPSPSESSAISIKHHPAYHQYVPAYRGQYHHHQHPTNTNEWDVHLVRWEYNWNHHELGQYCKNFLLAHWGIKKQVETSKKSMVSHLANLNADLLVPRLDLICQGLTSASSKVGDVENVAKKFLKVKATIFSNFLHQEKTH